MYDHTERGVSDVRGSERTEREIFFLPTHLSKTRYDTIQRFNTNKFVTFFLPTRLSHTHYDIIQHRNFFMPNRRNTKHIKVFNGKICIYLKNEDFKKRLVKYTMKLLKEWFFKYCDKIENNKKTLLMSCFNKYKNKNKTYIQNLYENIETFLLTYSASIKSIILKRIKEEKSSDNKITILNRLLENI